LFPLAFNLANFLRRLVPHKPIKKLVLTTLREKLIKLVAPVVKHSRYVLFQLAEVAVPRRLLGRILGRITLLWLVCALGPAWTAPATESESHRCMSPVRGTGLFRGLG
jgi:hypothetical protein